MYFISDLHAPAMVEVCYVQELVAIVDFFGEPVVFDLILVVVRLVAEKN